MIIKRNLLCVKAKEKLELGELLLFEPYKNILENFHNLVVNITAQAFDPVAKVYDGLLSVPNDIKEYYESLLGVTSYYQHSQGGKGKYIEKKLASSFETCSLNIELSTVPLWLEYPNLHKKKGIYTIQGLSDDEKKIIRTTDWDWIGQKDVSIDVGSIIHNEKSVVLIEVKNRVDTGGTAGRREIWTSEKFGTIYNYLDANEKLYRKGKDKFSLSELFENFDIKTLELYIGVLFDISDNPATIEVDRTNGFYSSSKSGFEDLKDRITKSSTVELQQYDDTNLQVEFKLTHSNLKVKIGALYGNDITLKLFRKELPVTDLLLLRFDDIWFSQLLTINERAMLLKHQKNFTTIFLDLLKRDKELRTKYDDLVNSENSDDKLIEIVKYLLNKYTRIFADTLLPAGKEKTEYLADVIQFICACE